ncbi:MAG: RNA polymerase-binding protein RbpA [Bifidobacteriaceae bacterium]|jgi:hypothetical protein|nr:RNA polymerase-binding protein RbpA [Bifidobacteriaceae bacterium]
MAERSLRGSGIGFQSLESEEGVEFAARAEVAYDCPDGHTTILPFALEAEVPDFWQCRCGAAGVLRGARDPEPPRTRRQRTHWDMLLERRTIGELEDVLSECLELLRARRGDPAEDRPVAV